MHLPLCSDCLQRRVLSLMHQDSLAFPAASAPLLFGLRASFSHDQCVCNTTVYFEPLRIHQMPSQQSCFTHTSLLVWGTKFRACSHYMNPLKLQIVLRDFTSFSLFHGDSLNWYWKTVVRCQGHNLQSHSHWLRQNFPLPRQRPPQMRLLFVLCNVDSYLCTLQE